MMIEPEAFQFIFNEEIYLAQKKAKTGDNKVLFYLDEKEKLYDEFLQKIIAAIKLSPENVEIKSPDEFSNHLLEGIIVVFDSDSKDRQELYKIKSHKEASLLIVDSLDKIMNDQELKRKLWGCLKELFN